MQTRLVPSGTRELGRGFEVKPSIGRRSSGDRTDRIKLRPLVVLHPPGRGRARYEEEQRSPGTHTEVRPGVVVVVQCGVSSLSSSSVVRIDGAGDGGSSCGGPGVRAGWAVVGAAV